MIICLIKYPDVTIVERSGQNTGLVIDTYSLRLYISINASVSSVRQLKNIFDHGPFGNHQVAETGNHPHIMTFSGLGRHFYTN